MLPAMQSTLRADEDDDRVLGSSEELGSSRSSLPNHHWRSDGLLDVNPQGAHPIYELLRSAEAHWDRKLRRASKTLQQAVNEYKKRYKRPPPKGFDHWWDYVQKYNVQLPDEYDQIYRDLEPYWGIDPRDLQEAQLEWEAHRDTFTIGKTTDDGALTILNSSMAEERRSDFLKWGAEPQLQILDEVQKYIPAFRATMSPHDVPNLLADWKWRNAAVEAARKGTYLTKPEHLEPLERLGWSGACPRDSPLYMDPPARREDLTPQKAKTFIHDHRATMDPCYHPQHLLNHGSFLAYNFDPVPSRFTPPQFSFSATTLHIDIHATSMAQTSAFLEDDQPWEFKDDDRLFWRGSPTGIVCREGLNWRGSQRIRLANITAGPEIEHRLWDPDFASVRYLRPDKGDDEPVGAPTHFDRQIINNVIMNIALTGKMENYCRDSVCETMAKELPWGNFVTDGPSGAGRYKYVIDVDGNGWSARFRRLMSSHSLVFKSTLYPEWWTDRVQPWVHYVPVQIDYSDLYDSLVFFAGDIGGEGAHEEMAQQIGIAGREWTSTFWRKEDVTAYMLRLMLEYARVMSEDRDSMTYHGP